jgi:ion channel
MLWPKSLIAGWQRILRHHDRVVDLSNRHPAVLILFFFLGILLSVMILFILVIPQMIFPPLFERMRPPSNILYYLYLPMILLVWSYYIQLSLRTASIVMPREKIGGSVYRTAQLIGSFVFFFAVIHYYVALSSEKPAYAGLDLHKPSAERSLLALLLFKPSGKTFIDLLYFSASTTATVGYGDIHPSSALAKLVTTLQMILSFVLVVIVLGWNLGHSTSIKE